MQSEPSSANRMIVVDRPRSAKRPPIAVTASPSSLKAEIDGRAGSLEEAARAAGRRLSAMMAWFRASW